MCGAVVEQKLTAFNELGGFVDQVMVPNATCMVRGQWRGNKREECRQLCSAGDLGGKFRLAVIPLANCCLAP
jgi:hypothetical protein